MKKKLLIYAGIITSILITACVLFLYSNQYKIIEWKRVYQKIGIQADFSGLKIPPKRDGFDRLIIVSKGTTPVQISNVCLEVFPINEWIDLRENDRDIKSLKEDRNAKEKAYAVWVKDEVNVGEEFKNLSTQEIWDKKLSGITLTERLLFEFKYYLEEKEHLDVMGSSMTLCTGAYLPDSLGFYFGTKDNKIPIVSWSGGLYIDFTKINTGRPYLRVREVISF